MIIVPGAAGEIGVLARHAPLIATLKAGSTRVHVSGTRCSSSRPARASSRSSRTVRSRSSTTPSRRDEIDDARAQRAARGGAGGAREDRARRVDGRPLAARAAHPARREPALGRRPAAAAVASRGRGAALPAYGSPGDRGWSRLRRRRVRLGAGRTAFYRDVLGRRAGRAGARAATPYRLGEQQLERARAGLDAAPARGRSGATRQLAISASAGRADRRTRSAPGGARSRGRAGPCRAAGRARARPQRLLPRPGREPARADLSRLAVRARPRAALAKRAAAPISASLGEDLRATGPASSVTGCYADHPESFERQLGDRVTKRLKSPRASGSRAS